MDRRGWAVVAIVGLAALYVFVPRVDPTKPLPSFDLPDVHGRRVDVRDFRGRVVVVGFFSHTGYGANGRVVGFLEQLWLARREQGLSVVGVTAGLPSHPRAEDERPGGALFAAHAQTLSALLNYHHVTFPVVSDVDSVVCRAYGACPPDERSAPEDERDALYADPRYCRPTMYLFDRRGRQRDRRCASTDEDASIIEGEVHLALLAE